MTPSGQAGGGAGGGAPSSAGANGSTVRSAALVTLGVVIGLAVVAVMAIARSDPAARGVPTTFRQHGSANDRTMLRPGGDALGRGHRCARAADSSGLFAVGVGGRQLGTAWQWQACEGAEEAWVFCKFVTS